MATVSMWSSDYFTSLSPTERAETMCQRPPDRSFDRL
jgi:hypothetical protein